MISQGRGVINEFVPEISLNQCRLLGFLFQITQVPFPDAMIFPTESVNIPSQCAIFFPRRITFPFAMRSASG